jgi:beta-lactam-binding protein with PASTA domain
MQSATHAWRNHAGIRRISRWVLAPLLVGFFFLEIFDLVVMPLWTRHGREFPAPNLVGSSLQAAQQVLEETGSAMQIAERRFSPDFPEGTILEQRPLAGAPVKRGRVFNLVLSRGSELIDVPRLRGYTVRQAELIIAQVGLIVGGHGSEADDSIPSGTVVRTIPRAGTSLPKGSVINILVNDRTRSNITWCPNLVGLNIEEARDILRERSLLVGSISREYDPTLLPGTIISQSSSPGEELALGSEIDLVISRDQ